MKNEKDIVLIRLSSLGDVAMLVPVLISFHESYPDKRINLISRQRFEPIFRELEYVNFIGIDKDVKSLNLLNLIRFYLNFPFKFNTIYLDCHSVLRTKILNIIFRLNGNKSFTIDKGRKEKRALIRLENKELVQLKTTHERYLEVFFKAGFKFNLSENAFLKKINLQVKTEKWIGIAPFAKHSSKQLDLNKWKDIISKLQTDKSNLKFYIFGAGSHERNLAKFTFSDLPNIENTIIKLNFEEELNLISQLDLMISMDSGNGHLAANYGIPVLTIWGSTHPCLGFAPFLQPIQNSFFPDNEIYSYLPVSIFGKNTPENYQNAINTIDTNKLIYRIKEILNF